MKLSIALVTSFLLVLGGVAHAQEPPNPDQVSASATDVAKTAGCPVAGPAAAGQAPYDEQCVGYSQSIDPSPEGGAKYACDVAGALLKGIADNGGGAQSAPLAALRQEHCPPDLTPTTTGVSCTTNCTANVKGNVTNPTPQPGGGSDVLGQSLPRTGGGEALTLMGFVVSSLGVLARRLLP